MMGYQRRVYKLVFDDPEMNGLEVTARSVSIGVMRRVMALSDEEGTPETLFKMAEEFSKALVSWNLEEDGVPVPATLEGLEDQDSNFLLEVIGAWTSTIARVDDASPLDSDSDSGPLSLAGSIPMETLSSSLAS